jgi:hypothetical protein
MTSTQPQSYGLPANDSERSRYIDSIAWAIFFLFVGGALLAQLPWSWFFIGLGLLVGGAQAARWQLGLKVEGFWVACAAVFIVGGAWDLLAFPWPLAPILLIALGVILLGRIMLPGRPATG